MSTVETKFGFLDTLSVVAVLKNLGNPTDDNDKEIYSLLIYLGSGGNMDFRYSSEIQREKDYQKLLKAKKEDDETLGSLMQ